MKVLVIAAHPDDEILGVGGTLLKHKEQGDEIYICIVTRTYAPEWSEEYIEIKKTEACEVDEIIGTTKRFYCDFPTMKLNTIPTIEFNGRIQQIVNEVAPDIVYTHSPIDINNDHKIIFQSVLVATRPISKYIKVLCFETLSSSEWGDEIFIPNYYVDISNHIEKKIEAFLKYKSEVKTFPHPRSEKGIKILASQRGMDISKEFAEAFRIVRSFW